MFASIIERKTLANWPIAQLFSTGVNLTFRLKVVNTEYFPEACSFFLIEAIESRSVSNDHRFGSLAHSSGISWLEKVKR
jgi:hypothetical protein